MGKPRIALLGGGQLGRMFIENALRYDADVSVLDPDPACSCATLATRFTPGSFHDRDTVLRFAADADVVGIEIEHVSVEALERLEQQGKRVIPSSGTLRIIQDKGLQKQFYRDHDIPTTDFALIEDPEQIAQHSKLLPAFLKTRTGGYDGKGVMPIRSTADIAKAFQGPCVLEQQADIAKELAVIAVRALDGTMAAYDPVEMVFDPKLNLVDVLIAPAAVDATVQQQAKALALRVAEAFGSPGILAVELFLTKDGRLLVNETAPRAHNSGHHTIEACSSSQYDQLLRAYMDWPLGSTTLRSPAAMINLIGEGGTGPTTLEGASELLDTPDVFIHLYGKRETRNGRKMGHVTVLGATRADLERSIGKVKQHLRIVPGAPLEAQPHN
ncbi:MAG TPA: 5-(carboxyamino)imidazole ribonucleotide synthase [Flavobacteriales bacterium]